LAIIVIKGKALSSKPLFPKLSKHTYLMAKVSRNKVKSNTSSSLKYVISDEDTLFSDNYDSSDDDKPLPSELVKNPNAIIKGLMRQVGARDELLEQKEELLVQERKISEELKKLLALEKVKVEKLDQNIAKSKETTCSITSSIDTLQGQYDILLKTHQDLEVQFDALWLSTSKTSTNNKASTSQVSVKTYYDQIVQENDHLKREAKKLELEVNK
jgi:ribonucleotide reductase alpha subunit